ncbi:MAG: phenylacetic acid degradation operon negative regulatory protein PaaX [Salinisphaera sp.]|nr:phenylacetic acid degradation operon negative regulatory protein PaaX [Salinisphaera sp.]
MNEIQTAIQNLLTTTPPRSKSLIVSLLGDAIEPRGGSFWMGTLIQLLAPFGINERSARTSVQRLSQDGWLRSERHGRRSRYSLTDEGLARIVQSRPRFYAPPRPDWDGRWAVVLIPSGSAQGRSRMRLRQYLEWEGYSMASSGLFIHPLGSAQAVRQILDELGLQDQVYVFSATSLEGAGALGLDDGVARFWDLDSSRKDYRRFIQAFGRWPELVAAAPQAVTAEQCFQLRLLTIHAFRRAALHAPRLPQELFPDHWEGLWAYDLCRSLYHRLWADAERFLSQRMADSDEPVTPLKPSFYARFGGLKGAANSAEDGVRNARAVA